MYLVYNKKSNGKYIKKNSFIQIFEYIKDYLQTYRSQMYMYIYTCK